jgi:crotonobetainyl-CoA:carnitine CoA-transferase CaiB-like acyl-CoA transferase
VSALLARLKVLEMTDDLGAYAGRILAELGADVLKIGRRRPEPAWRVANAGKALVDLDLGVVEERARVEGLAGEADILLQGDRDRLADAGLDYGRLATRNPGLISVVVAPFAEGGPMAGEPATDLTLMAMSGVMHMVGEPERPPRKLPGEQAYALAGAQGVVAALTALAERRRSGLGQRVVVSAFQSAVLAGYRDPIVWEWTGRIGQRTGNRLVRGASGVRQVWRARDGHVTWSLVDNPGMMRGMVALMTEDGAADGLAEVDWDKVLVAETAQAQIDAWEAQLERWFASQSKHELARLSAERGLGLSKIDTPEEAPVAEQWRERGFWRRLADPAGGPDLPVPGPLFRTTAALPADPAPARDAEGFAA